MYEIIITILIILLLVSVIRKRGSKQKFKQDCEKQDFLDTIFYATEYSPASIIIANENCEILDVNRQVVTMSGYMPDEVIGKKTNMMNSGMTNPSVYEDIWSTLDRGETFRGRSALILVDGIPQSNPLRPTGREIHTIDFSMIERIEVIHGANATNGLGATGGVINLITRRPENGTFNQHVSVQTTLPTEKIRG